MALSEAERKVIQDLFHGLIKDEENVRIILADPYVKHAVRLQEQLDRYAELLERAKGRIDMECDDIEFVTEISRALGERR